MAENVIADHGEEVSMKSDGDPQVIKKDPEKMAEDIISNSGEEIMVESDGDPQIITKDPEKMAEGVIVDPEEEIMVEKDGDPLVITKNPEKMAEDIIANSGEEIMVESDGDPHIITKDPEKMAEDVIANSGEEIMLESGGDPHIIIKDPEKMVEDIIADRGEVVVESIGDPQVIAKDPEKIATDVIDNPEEEIVVEKDGDPLVITKNPEKMVEDVIADRGEEVMVESGGDPQVITKDPEEMAEDVIANRGEEVIVESDGDAQVITKNLETMEENVTVSREEKISASITESDYDPDYLKDVIKKNEKVKSRFLQIIGGEPKPISQELVHEKAQRRASGDLGIFYRYFFTKYISIRLKEDAKSDILDDYASIFPFQTKAADLLDVKDMPELDSEFSAEIKEFVEKHFGSNCDVDGLKNLFWANIRDFKENHIPTPPSLNQLACLITVGSTLVSRSEGPERDTFPVSEHLKKCTRLNRGGTYWYEDFKTKFNDACKAYGKELRLPPKLGFYFRFLPEINVCELLLLLETKFYESDRAKYLHLFKKYLFFFKYASDRREHPVCFIDEALFACLQFKREYETFREDKSIYDCLWELSMMTLVHCRKYIYDSRQKANLKPDQSDLEKVVAYADKLLEGVQSVNVYYGEPQCQRFKVFLLLDDTVFLVHYSGRAGPNSNDLIGQILKSALLSPEIKRLKFYNAYVGEEIVYEMPQQKEEIRKFVHQLTESESVANRLEPEYPMKFLISPKVRKYFSILPAIPRY